MQHPILNELERMGYLNPKGRGFKPVPRQFRDSATVEEYVPLPKRATAASAGYDFVCPEDLYIAPGAKTDVIWTDVCAFMEQDEVLLLFPRSSVGIKLGLTLANTTGVIDSDYYGNAHNFGNIGIILRNLSDTEAEIKRGERIAQGVFTKYLIATDDETFGNREGGMGSTGK